MTIIRRRYGGSWRVLGHGATSTAPLPPQDVRAVSAAGETATVTWTAPDDGGSAITGYTLTVVRVSAGAVATLTPPANAVSATVSGLVGGELYRFTMTATNAVGTSEVSDASQTVIAVTSVISHGEQLTKEMTGVRPGVTLTDVGSYQTQGPGETHVGKRFTALGIRHAGCTFIDCEINYGGSLYAARVYGTYSPLPRLEFCTINAGTGSTSVSGVATGGIEMYRCRVWGGVNGTFINAQCLIEECFISGQYHPAGTHADAVQITNNGGTYSRIRRSKILAFDMTTNGDYNPTATSNAAIQVGSLTGPLANLDVSDTYLDGGNYTVSHNDTRNGTHGNPTGVWRRNKFGRGGSFGAQNRIAQYFDFDATNVWADTGLPVA